MAKDKLDVLFDALSNDGADVGTREQFKEYMLKPGDEGYQNRLKFYNAMRDDGAEVGDTYETFRDWLFGGPKVAGVSESTEDDVPGAPLAHDAVSGEDARGLEKTAEDAGTASGNTGGVTPAPGAQNAGGYKPSPSFLSNLHSSMRAYDERSRRRKEQVHRAVGAMTPAGRQQAKAGKMAAQMAGTPSRVMGLTPPVPKDDMAVGAEAKQQKLPTRGATPYDVVVEDGERKTRWLLPDGRLTTDLLEADRSEYAAVQGRLNEAFRQRMRSGGLDPDSSDDVQTQAMRDLFSRHDADEAAAKVWEAAEARTAESLRQTESNPFLTALPQAEVARAIEARSADMTHHDLQRMADEAWDALGKERQDAIIDDLATALGKGRPGVDEQEVMATAAKIARAQSDRAMVDYAIKMNAPQSATEFFIRKAVGTNAISSLIDAASRVQAGTRGDMLARDEAESEYERQGHRVAGIGGTVTGFMFDPLMLVSGGVGGSAVKGASWLAGRYAILNALGRGATRAVAERFGAAAVRRGMETLGGRLAAGVVGGAANFATFEGLGEGLEQLRVGGYRDPETGEVGGYSIGAIGDRAAHGFLMGAATGVVAPLMGNVSDKLVRATESTVGKMGIRIGQLGVSTVTEGTIFATPELIATASNFNEQIKSLSDVTSPNYIADVEERKKKIAELRDKRGDAMMDTWTQTLAMIGGFKAGHALKSAPDRIAELSHSKGESRRKWLEGFETRLRMALDGRHRDLALSREEREELERNGHADLLKIVDDYQWLSDAERRRKARVDEIRRTSGYDEETAKKIADAESPLPFTEFTSLMTDNKVSASARAKMYYYLTGNKLPTPTILGYNFVEHKDADGNIVGYTVQSVGAIGVITSRNFTSKQRAEVERNAIMRQAELNSIDIGERHVSDVYEEKRTQEACRRVSSETGAPVSILLDIVKNGPRNDVEQKWAERIFEVHKSLGDDGFDALKGMVRNDSDVFVDGGGEHVESVSKIRAAVGREFGVDVDKAIRKEPNRRSEKEQQAIEEYVNRLFADIKTKEDAARNSEPRDLNSPSAPSEIAGLLGMGDDDAPGSQMSDAQRRGYDADSQGRRDIAIALADPNNAGNADLQEAWSGVVQRINEEAAYNAAIDREESKQMRHTDGSIHPAVLKNNEENGWVYIVDGTVAMTPDGTGIDPTTSDKSVIIYNPVTGKTEMIDPTSSTGLSRLGEVISWDDREAQIESVRQQYVQAMIDDAQGKIFVAPGQQLVLPNGEEAVVASVDGDNITVNLNNNTQANVSLAELQRVADETALADYRQRHGITEETSQSQSSGVVEGAPADYVEGVEITVRDDDGVEKPAMVMGRVRYENGSFVPDANGNIIEYFIDGEVKHDHEDKLVDKVVSHVPLGGEDARGVQRTGEDERGSGSLEAQRTEGQNDGSAEGRGAEPMPVDDNGKKDYRRAGAERTERHIYDELGLSEAAADKVVANNVKAVAEALKKARKAAEKVGDNITDPDEMVIAERKAREAIEDAEAAKAFWEEVQARRAAAINAERERVAAEQAERERIAHEQAVADEAARQAEVLAKREEQAQRGAHTVHPAIREKWEAAPKIEGFESEIPLHDGTTVKGRYMLVESGAVTPSHNAAMDFARSEGFPVDENGNTINDRDYERDRDAQDVTREMGRTFDSRAIQDTPVVSRDGVVLSGNGRTMAGELAARDNTDGAYLDHLTKFGRQYGFTPEQVSSMQHPRLVFVADEDMPYTTETFAKFNAQQMKSQDRTETAVKLGKTVDDNTFGRIVGDINRFDTLAQFYNDPKASVEAINDLRRSGVITPMQYAEMFDGKKVSLIGRQMLENMLLGKAFESNPDALRELAKYPQLRQSVVAALAEISNNKRLGDYSLEHELSEAIHLAYTALEKGRKQGDVVSDIARQLNLFPFDLGRGSVVDYTNASILMLADVLNSTEVNKLRNVLALYNDRAGNASNGTISIDFGGEAGSGFVESKSQIIKDVLNIIENGDRKEKQRAIDEARERRKDAAETEQGDSGTEQDGTVERSDSGGEDAESKRRLADSRRDVERGEGLSEEEADDLILASAERAIPMPDFEFTHENWKEEFGDGRLQTPVEEIKIGENQFSKMIDKGREKEAGLIKPTFTDPDFVIEEASVAADGITERASSHLYVKSFIGKDGKKRYFFKSVTVKRDGLEVNVSSHFDRPKRLREALKNGKLLYRFDGGAQTEQTPASVSVTTSRTNPGVSVGKGSENSETGKEKTEKVAESKASTVIAEAEQDVNTEPTDAQKEAGNYKKGHIKLDGFDISIEQPKGSTRSGRDASGKEWSVTMQNTYGYIRGTEGVDGDHIDVFLSDNMDDWNGTVYVIDQVKADGSFDEHKVMYGFNSAEEAAAAYNSNYSEGWQGLGTITGVSKEEFKKWIGSSHRKTKPFADYKKVKTDEGQSKPVVDDMVENPDNLEALRAKHPNALFLVRGQKLYKAYGEDAKKLGEILGVEVKPDKKYGFVASFDHNDLDTNLPKLVRAGLRVAITDTSVLKGDKPASGKKKTTKAADIAAEQNENNAPVRPVDGDIARFHKETDNSGRTAIDEANYNADDLVAPLLVDGKKSHIGIIHIVPDDINAPTYTRAYYNYAHLIDPETNKGWQAVGDKIDEWNGSHKNDERGFEDDDAPMVRFASVDAALKFAEWFEGEKIRYDRQGKPIQGLEGRSEEEVLAIVRGHIEEVLSDEGVDGVTLKGMALHGSRLRGDAKEGSDLDVVVEFDGDMREDDMFNMLNAESNRLSIDGISVDINPIREDKSGTLERYMERSRKYDESKGGRERTGEDERGQGALEARRTEGQKDGSEEEAAIERKAKADGSWLTAPNGERSRLAPRQWLQTRTKAFKKWFGDSKIVDENGEPLVVDGCYVSTAIDFVGKYNELIGRANDVVARIRDIERASGTHFPSMEFMYADGADDVMGVLTNDNDVDALVESILNGEEPVVRLAFRYGDVPEGGRSLNYRDNEREKGVSVVGRVADMNTRRSSYYETWFGDEPYNIVVGLDLGNRVADGEMLLTAPVVLCKAQDAGDVVKSATDNNGDFSRSNTDIRYAVSEDSRGRERTAEESRGKKADGVATRREAELRDALVEVMRQAGLAVVVDDAEGQRVLDAYRERVRAMGSRVDKRMAEIAKELQGRQLTSEQQAVVDVFTGKTKSEKISVSDRKGKTRTIELVAGQETKAGTKHSIYHHYLTTSDFFKADELLYIPHIIETGSRKQDGKRVAYFTNIGGVIFTVTTEIKGKVERFTNFFTNRKPIRKEQGTQNTDEQRVQPSESVLGAKLQKAGDNTSDIAKKSAESAALFDGAKKKFGVTRDIREAGYVLPDGTMLDFSGRHELLGADDSDIRGHRFTDHRAVDQIGWMYDENGDEVETGLATDMPDFIERGAIRIDCNAGTINLATAPTAAQRKVLRELIARNGGDVQVDFGNGWDSAHYAEYSEAKATRVLGDIERYFSEGVRPKGDIQFFRTAEGEVYGFVKDGVIYLDPKLADAETAIHEYGHLWGEALRAKNPAAWARLRGEMEADAELMAYVKSLYPELEGDALIDEVFQRYAGKRGAERLRAERDQMLGQADGILGKAGVVALFDKLRRLLERFWRMSRDLFAGVVDGLDRLSGADFADMMLADLLGGFNPNAAGARGEGLVAETGVADPFYSNAARAVENIKQGKAKAEQWKAMLTKAGGIKAGEDKWMGLTQWLDEHKGETLTKEQVLEFVRENGVKMVEREYIEAPYSFESLKREYDQWLHDEGFDYAQEQLLERFGDDADLAFDDLGGELVIANEEAAAALLGSEDIINSTRLDYTTEGLDNKREIAFVVPGVEPYQEGDAVHFGPENEGKAVMWVRFGETTDADGNRVLVIDEIQSNRHQDAREKGYEDQALTERLKQIQQEIDAATKEFGDFNDTLRQKYGVSTNYTKIEKTREEWGWNHRLVPDEDVLTKEEVQKWKEGDGKIKALRDVKEKLLVDRMGQEGVPAAPFEKNWHEVAMKRMLRLAAEEGFDKVAWTTGEQQAERYDLGGVVDEIYSSVKSDGNRVVTIYLKSGRDMKLELDSEGKVVPIGRGEQFAGHHISEVVGKGVSEKIMSTDRDSLPEAIKGDGLRIGGEGMKGFYDQMLPRFMDKYGKKWGVKTGEVRLSTPGGEVMHSVDVTDAMRRSVLVEGQPLFQKAEDSAMLSQKTEEDLDKEYMDALNVVEKPERIEKLRRSEPVKITGEEIALSDDEKENKKSAQQYGRGLQGSYRNEDTGNEIHLQRGRKNGGVNEVLQHNYKDRPHLQSVAAIPQIIQKSILISSEANRDKAKNPDVVEYQHYVCGLKIGGMDYTVHALVAVDANGNRYYDHNLVEIEKGKLLDRISGQAAIDGFGTTPGTKPTTNSERKVNDLVSLLQTNADEIARAEEKMRSLLDEMARRRGYTSSIDYQGSLAFNGAAPSRNAYFDTKEERKAAFEDGSFEGDYSLGDFVDSGLDNNDLEWQIENPIPASGRDRATLSSLRNLRDVVKGKKRTIKMYRAVDASVKEDSFRNGDWVTPSREYAERHIGLQDWNEGRIIEQEVSIDDIWWNGDDINEWGYDDGNGYAYKNTSNNRKLTDLVTRDGAGQVIPPSKRFDEGKQDVRYREGDGGADLEASDAKVKRTMQEDRDMMRSAVQQMGEKLHTDINVIEDVESITHPNAAVQERRRKSKGWYDTATGQVNIVLDNNRDVDDVKATMGHETIAHKGLRELIGEERYNEFLDEVYKHLRDDLKKRVDDRAGRSFMNDTFGEGGKKRDYESHRREQVDELFGELAQKPFEEFNGKERNLWQWLKAKVRHLLNRFLGSLKLPKWFELGDNELRYMLWRSKERLERGKEHPIDLARDIAKREELGLGEDNTLYSETKKDAHPTRLQTSDDAQAVQRDAHLSGTKVEINSENREEIDKNLSSLAEKVAESQLPAEDFLAELRKSMKTESEDHSGYNIQVIDGEQLTMRISDHHANAKHNKQNGEFKVVSVVIKTPYSNNRFRPHKEVEMVEYTFDADKLTHDNEQNIVSGIQQWLETGQCDIEGAITVRRSPRPISEDSAVYRDPDETEDIWNDQSMGLDERITAAATRLANNHRDNRTMRDDAMRAIGGNLTNLRRAMSLQRRFDMTTVKRVADLARVLISGGYLNDMSANEVKRLLSAVKNSAGHDDVEASVQKVMDIMVDNQLKLGEATLHELETIRATRVDARGVEVQGALDPAGQVMMKAFKDGRMLRREALEEEIGKALDRMSSESESVREDAENAYAGLQFALQYNDRIAYSKHEEKVLRDELKQKHDETSKRDRATDSYRRYVSAMDDAIRQNKIDRAQAYFDLVAAMTDSLRESVANAQKFKEDERRRVQDIHHLANSDMQGMELRGQRPDSRLDRWNENVLLRWGLSPLHTFDQFMRLFGRKNADGKGYLYDYYVRNYIDSADHEQLMKEKYEGMLETKVKELFGTHKVGGGLRKVPYTYTSLYGYVDALPMTKVTYYDGAGKREYELSQAQLAYLYMVDKMPMGKATNRGMGVTEEVIEQIEESLDPKLKEFVDWVQEEFLVELGNECNEVHKRMFGANMDSIEHYFPFVRDKNSIKREVENGAGESMAERISTKTGAIIKRTPSVANWDMPNANFLDVLAKHVSEMCQWSSYAELNRDLGTLQSFNRFKQQVLDMRTIYGSGEQLWKRFMQTCAIAGNAYEPKRGEADKLMVQGAKGVVMGKIAFRPFTALKQILSLPAFFGEVDMECLSRDFATGGIASVKWAWENMPNFRKRIKSRTAGDFRLSATKYDKEKGWTNTLMRISAYGMLPNIGVDAWTIALGSHAVYVKAKKKYLRQGYSDEKAERRAVQDAELCFNKSQQSSEGAFMAPVQIDHTFASTTMMLFRNSSTSYTRECVTSVRNLKRMMSGKVDVDFMAKQILRNAEIPTFSILFDAELQRQVEGTLPVGHIYSLGMPGGVLQSAGFPDAPIELSSTRLAEKSSDPGHPFPIEALKGLVDAMNKPIAVFKYGNNAMNVIVGLAYKGKQFLVGVHFNQHRGGMEVSSVRGLFPKDNAEWLNWISQSKARYLDHQKIKALIAQQRINLADVDYLDLKDVAKVMKTFVNPAIPEQKYFAGWRAEDVERAREQARKEYRSGYIRNSVNAVMFGYILPWLWRIGGLSILLTLGDDDDDKVSEVKKASKQSLFGPLEGIAYGDVIADGLYVSANKLFGDGTEKFSNLGRTNPFLSDLAGVLRKLDGDQMAAVNDVLNMLVGMNTGVNLQTVSDWATAILDYSPDGDTSREVSLLVSRLLNAPQSQIEKIYFDEIGMTGGEALHLSAQELVERYAQYKVKREHFVTPWVWGDEALLDKKRTKGIGIVKERVERLGDDKLQDVFDGGDMLLRSLAGKEAAQRLGGTDSYGSSDTEYNQIYTDKRDYLDLAEDVLLQHAKKEAKAAGDDERYKALDKAQRELTDIKKGKHTKSANVPGLGEGDDDKVMEQLRTRRRKMLEEFGITSQQTNR